MEIMMNKGEIICINGDARNLRISTRSGILWITQTGDPGDYLLKAGDSFLISRKGRVAITAFKTAQTHFSIPVSIKPDASFWQACVQSG